MTKITVALAAGFAIAGLFASSPPAAAIEYPWCAEYGGGEMGGGGRNCGFISVEQCMLTVRGMGGFCERNLFYPESVAKQPQPARKRARER